MKIDKAGGKYAKKISEIGWRQLRIVSSPKVFKQIWGVSMY